MKDLILSIVLLMSFVGTAFGEAVIEEQDTIDQHNNNPVFYGLRVFPHDKDSETLSRVVESEDVYSCLIKGARKDSLIVLANMKFDKFSIGGPYSGIEEKDIRAKFEKFEAVFWSDKEDCEDDCDPFDYMVIVGKDSISYSKLLHEVGKYELFDASICDNKFSYDDLTVGKQLKSCKIARYIPNDYLKRIKTILFLPYDSSVFEWVLRPFKPKEADWLYVTLVIENGIIKMIQLEAN